jgi:hypothetical protein
MERCGSFLNLSQRGFPKDLRKWFIQNYFDELDKAMLWIAHTHKIKKIGRNTQLATEATKKGYLKLLEWMDNNKFSVIDSHIINTAARYGHIDILKYMIMDVFRDEFWVCSEAAAGGQLETLKWLRKSGFSWDKCTCLFAAANGHLNVLMYAIDNGCDCTKQDILGQGSLRFFKPEIIDWINKNME